jgi:hypothetical protein
VRARKVNTLLKQFQVQLEREAHLETERVAKQIEVECQQNVAKLSAEKGAREAEIRQL